MRLNGVQCFLHCVQTCGRYDAQTIQSVEYTINSDIQLFSSKSINSLSQLGPITIVNYPDDGKIKHTEFNKQFPLP